MFRLGALVGAAALVLSACDAQLEPELEKRVAPLVLAPNAWQLELSNPGTSAATAVDMPIDERVIDAIDGATTSVDIAVYNFDHPGITQAVLRAKARGLRVRFVGQADELATSNGMKAIQQAGVPMTLRPGSALMHHKVMIVDGHLVAFGSFNFTTTAADQNNENLLFVDSAELAATFQGELDQLIAGKFGSKKVARATRPTIPVDGGSIQVHFSPKEQTSTRLREAIATASTRVYFMTYSFTLSDVANDLIALKNAGVEVVGVFDKGAASNQYSQDEHLINNGVRVYLDGNENSSGFAGGRLHDKVMIIDAGGSYPMVVTGSYNWSAGATDSNDETLAILRGAKLVAPYVAEFCRIYKVSSASTQNAAAPTLCQERPLVALTEVLANPDGTDKNEEYVEVTNLGGAPLDLSGWQIGDALSPSRHVFAAGTMLAPHSAVVVYSGPGAGTRVIASSAQLSINNDAETMTLRNASGAIVDQVTLGVGVSGESVHRADVGLEDLDFDGRVDGATWGQHTTLSPNGLALSPGLRVDGTSWSPVVTAPEQSPSDDPPASSVTAVVVANALPNPIGADRPDEYVTIVNSGSVTIDLSGWSLGDVSSPHRHVFASGTSILGGQAIRIYDGGTHVDGIAASSGALSLNNDSETVTLWDAHGAIASALSWRNAGEGSVFAQ